jgi:outer membrane immunogenic protein
MKKTLAAATIAALVGVAGAANAADLYKGGSMKDVPAYTPPPVWTGFYIGGHVGGAWGESKNAYNYDPNSSYVSVSGFPTDSWSNTNDGVFGGGTVGYNWQASGFGAGGIVLGIEADFGAMGFSNNNMYANTYWNKQDASFYADVTGRLGYAMGPALLYAKGGWAYLDNAGSFGAGVGLNNWWTGTNNSLDGWTIGGGVEYMWSPSWSVKAEYQYFDFGKQNYSTVYGAGYTDTWCNELTVNTFKVGLNYHLNNVYAPLK